MRIRHRMVPFVAVFVALIVALFVALSTSPTVAATKATKSIPSIAKSKQPATTVKRRTGTPSAASTNAPPTSMPPVRFSGSINVFAASSLMSSLTDISLAFEKMNPGVNVVLNFAGSSTLAAQIQNGAPADVFASADTTNMTKLVSSKLIEDTPTIFTRNKLMIVVGKGNPFRVKSLADLANPDLFVALGAPGVPVGDYARQMLAKADVKITPKTLEANVASIVNKVALREIDAGVVYVTDVAIDDYRVDGIAISDDQNVIATYPVAVVSTGKNISTATGFVLFTQTPTAQAVFAKYKFLPLK